MKDRVGINIKMSFDHWLPCHTEGAWLRFQLPLRVDAGSGKGLIAWSMALL